MSYPGWTPERKAVRGRSHPSNQRTHKARNLERAAIFNSIRSHGYNPPHVPKAQGGIAPSSPLKRARDEEADKLLPVSDAGEATPSSSKRRKVDSNAAQPGPSRLTTESVRFHPSESDIEPATPSPSKRRKVESNAAQPGPSYPAAEVIRSNPDAGGIKSRSEMFLAEANDKGHVNVGPVVQVSPTGFTLEEMAEFEAMGFTEKDIGEFWAMFLPTVPSSQPSAIPPTPRIVAETPTPEASLSLVSSDIPRIVVEPPTPEEPSFRQSFERNGKSIVKYDTFINLTDFDPVEGDVDDEGWSEESSDDLEEVELLDSFGTTRQEQAKLIAHPGMVNSSPEETVQKPAGDVKGKGKGKARADPPIQAHTYHTTKAVPPQARLSGTKPPIRSDADATVYKQVLHRIFCKLSDVDGRMALHAYNQLMHLVYIRGFQAGLQAR